MLLIPLRTYQAFVKTTVDMHADLVYVYVPIILPIAIPHPIPVECQGYITAIDQCIPCAIGMLSILALASFICHALYWSDERHKRKCV